MMSHCEEYRTLRLLDVQIRQDVTAPMQATYLEQEILPRINKLVEGVTAASTAQ